MPDQRLERFAYDLDWNLLRTFVVLVEEGSITAAANRLLLHQPAASMALKRLEQTVGQKLIDRRPGRFDLTEAGEKLHRQCREVIRLIAANIGIGMLPCHLAAPELAAGKLWQLPPYDLLPATDVFRISNPNAILNPAEAAFLKYVEDVEPLDHSI